MKFDVNKINEKKLMNLHFYNNNIISLSKKINFINNYFDLFKFPLNQNQNQNKSIEDIENNSIKLNESLIDEINQLVNNEISSKCKIK